MFRIDSSSASLTLPTPAAVGPNPNGYWTDGNPTTDTLATALDQDWFNSIQEELCGVVEGAGISLVKESGGTLVTNQLLTAIKSLINNRFPTKFRKTAPPVVASNTTLTIAYVYARSADDTVNIVKLANTVNIAANGINALDTGSPAPNTWYYLYHGCKPDGTGAGSILSAQNVAGGGTLTVPSGYDATQFIQERYAVPTDASSHLIPIYAVSWGDTPELHYTNFTSAPYGGGAGPFDIVYGVNPTSWTHYSAASFVPPISTEMVAAYDIGYVSSSSDQQVYYNLTGSGSGILLGGGSISYGTRCNYTKLPLSSSQGFYLEQTSNGINTIIHCRGYIVNGIN